ncbi:MAG: hypothetical protein WDO73_20370 [Ignavibacteriota bacterium]
MVGIVGHVKHWGLDSDDTSKLRDQMYFPFDQIPDKYMPQAMAGLTLTVRSQTEPLSLVSNVAAQVAGPTRDQPLFGVRTMEQIISRSLAERAFHDVAPVDLRGDRPGAGRDRDLRSHVVRGDAPASRNWHPFGARRHPRRDYRGWCCAAACG